MNLFHSKTTTIGIAILMVFISCNKDTIANIFDLHISNQLVINVLNIQVIDAFNFNSFANGDILVEVVGDNQGKVKIYSLDGHDSLSYVNGFINLGVPPRDTPSVKHPLLFSLRIRHKTLPYLEEVVHYKIISNEIRSDVVRLLNLGQLPKGVKAHPINGQTGSISDSCKTSDEIVFSNEFAPNQKTVIKIPKGTRFFDKAGKNLCGEIKGTLLSFNYRDTVASFLPGGLSYKAKDVSWTEINRGILNLYDFFSLEITVDKQFVHSFSKPCEVSLSKNTSTLRTLSEPGIGLPISRTLENGDDVPIWRLISKDTAIWEPDNLVKIANNQIIFNISNTGWWNIADPSCQGLYDWFYRKFRPPFQPPIFTNASCPKCIPTITLMVDTTIHSSYYTEISLKSNPRMIVASPMIEYKNDKKLALGDYLGEMDKDVGIKIAIFSSEPWNGGMQMASKEFKPCYDPTLNWVSESRQFPQYGRITTLFSLNCPNPNGTATNLLPTASIYAKELSNNGLNEAGLWSYVGIIRNGEGSSQNHLQGGKMYKFGIFPSSNYSFTTDDIEIRQDNVVKRGITIPSGLNTDIVVNFKKAAWQLDESVVIKCLFQKNYSLDKVWTPSARTCEGYKRRL